MTDQIPKIKVVRNNESIYIAEKHRDFWEELKIESKEHKKSIGDYILSELKKYRNMQKKESKV